MPHVLVTGGAGFIGSHLVDRLLAESWRVTVIDNFDPFYNRIIKMANIRNHLRNSAYRLLEQDIINPDAMRDLATQRFDVIVHLAAKAGVRPSILDPLAYQNVNVGGTQNILEFARKTNVPQFVFASSSSVYGVSPCVPWKEDAALLPISPYASTKLSAEFLGHVYSHLYGIRFLGLRFFTVYGPRQRPDLAIHKFARSILERKQISVFGDGGMRRDYTHVSDIVTGIMSAIAYNASSFEIINLGNNRTVELRELIALLEEITGSKALVERMQEQPGDVPQTWADLAKASTLLNYQPKTSLHDGLKDFIKWLCDETGYAVQYKKKIDSASGADSSYSIRRGSREA